MDTCSECGFTYGELDRDAIAPTMEELGRAISAGLSAPNEVLRRRRLADEWSPLEYACHLRDVLLMQRDRLYVALVEDEPSFKPMYREQRVAFDRYNEQPPDVAAAQLMMGAALLANAFDGLADEQWSRTLLYGFPGPTKRDVEWVGHHSLHEMVHHRADITRLVSGA